MQWTGKRLLALLLSACLLLGMAPAALALSGTAAIGNGAAVRWIDRIDLSGDTTGEIMKFYNALVEASDGDGVDDWLIEDSYYSTANQTQEIAKVSYTATAETFHAEGNTISAAYSSYANAAFDAFLRDHPEVFWLGGSRQFSVSMGGSGASYTLTFSLVLTNDTGADRLRATGYTNTAAIKSGISARNSAVNGVLAGASGTDYEKVQYFNQWLTQKNAYYNGGVNPSGATDSSHQCLSALQGSTATDGPVCEGYAKAFKVLCDKAGIPCVLVDGTGSPGGSGEAGAGAHMWNAVQLDGSWYGVDVTWNDPVPDQGASAVNENYLCVGTDTQINGKTFAASHVVENTVSATNPLAFLPGPTLAANQYDPASAPAGYTVSFAPNGGTGTMNPVTASGHYLLPACSFTAPAGKTFDAWQVSGMSGTFQPLDPIDISADTTVTALWKDASAPAVTYTITYNANGGAGSMANGTATAGKPFTLPACGFTAPAGKIFRGWRIGTEVFQAGSAYPGFNANTTVTAEWVDQVSIILQKLVIVTPPAKTAYNEGESFDPAGLTLKAVYSDGSEKAVALSLCRFEPQDGLKPTDTAVTIIYDEEYIIANATQPITVTAAPVFYTYSFDPGEGTGTIAGSTVQAGTSLTLPVASSGFVAPSGKQFKAWSAGGMELQPGDSYTVNANTTFTALWVDAATPVPVVDVSALSVPAALAGVTQTPQTPFGGITNVAALENEMIVQLQKAYPALPNTESYDVTLKVRINGVEQDATETDFNKLGSITVYLPRPAGSHATDSFYAIHVFEKGWGGKPVGGFEYLTGTVTADGQYVRFTLTGASPLLVGWTSAPAGHKHVPEANWSYDQYRHWKNCTVCGSPDYSTYAPHSYSWTVVKEATQTSPGERYGVCSVCGYQTPVQPYYLGGGGIGGGGAALPGFYPGLTATTPQIFSPAADTVVAGQVGETISFTVSAHHGGVFQWYVNRGDGRGFVPISGATAQTYSFRAEAGQDGWQFRCLVSNGSGQSESPTFTLRLTSAPLAVPPTGGAPTALLALGLFVLAALVLRRARREAR